MDPFQLISILLIYPSIWTLKIIGIDAHAYSGIIWAPNIVVLIIKVPCLAVKIMIAWLSIILPYNPLKNKFLLALYGILLIHFLNILRMTGIVYGASINQSWSTITHDLLNYIAYGLLFLFFIWITNKNREPYNKKTS
jgi:exosortase/archaeosortase family protein